jgi:hypothetical protein
MPQVIPLQPVPSQTLQCQVGNQAVTLDVYQLAYGLFVDVDWGENEIDGVIAHNAHLIVRYAYLGFEGDFIFVDTTGQGNDPVYTGLGTTFQLLYLSAAEIAALDLPSGVE